MIKKIPHSQMTIYSSSLIVIQIHSLYKYYYVILRLFFILSITIYFLSEAIEALNVNDQANSRTKRAAFSDDERRIAGVSI